ncbi:MAG TPA: hypothetical protein VEZ11_03365, partial [Thermoanaerobaculia bacterium]|nr:hypothetical protein [Thermoanaerobaculia bacterium]
PARIGNPHIRAHAAEGQLFRQVLETAAAKLGLASFVASPRDVWSKAGILLGQQDSSLRTRVHALGKGVVRPWRTVEQEATLAGWAALVVSARS